MLRTLRADAFRNYARLSLDLPEGVVVVYGQNAQGKTNLLEAIHLLGTGRLLRGRRDAEAIREGFAASKVEGELRETGSTLGVEIRSGVRKRAFFNGASLPRASDLLGRMPCVSFSNLDLSIVRGEPADRRMFLDAELSQIRPAYLRHLSVYRRALEQRNALLRAAREQAYPDDLFESWEHELAEHGAPMRAIRRAFLDDVGARATALHARVGSGEELRLEYRPSDEAETHEDLGRALAARRRRDVQAGATTVGPHRDDFVVWVESREGRSFASQGQQRTASIALKLAVLHLASDALPVRPVLLLDDVFSELDSRRRGALVQVAEELAGQTVLTCTEREQVGPGLGERASWVEVCAGEARMR